jgi:hypothetical protein
MQYALPPGKALLGWRKYIREQEDRDEQQSKLFD